jgi:multidrug efflux pump subunit AcrB
MILVLAMIVSERVIFQFFPAVTADDLYARVELPEGTPLAVTLEATARIEAAADRLSADLDAMTEDGLPAARARFTSIGQVIARSGMSLSAASGGAHVAEVSLALRPVSERGGLTPLEAISRWREYTGAIPDVVELSFSAAALSMGADINIELRGKDDRMLGKVASEIGDLLASFDGVLDISDSYRSGKQELTLAINDNGRSLGLTQAELGRQVRQAFYGAEAQRVQRGRDDVRVMVRYPESERDTLSHFETMRVRLLDGSRVPVLSVANVVLGRGYSAIKRVNGSRVVNITASTDRTRISPEALYSRIADDEIPGILSRHPGVEFHLAGEAEARAEALGGLIRMSVVALLVIYALLAIPLRSYLQPLVVMSSIPFGLLGAILGHFIMRQDLVFFSILGIVALSGVVVNASLVLVDYVNRQRRSGAMAAEQAVIAAGVTRFRPIILTSLTTFIGLVPLMINRDFDTILFVPLAISLGFGVVFATTVTLLLIPALYMVLEDFQRWVRGGDYRIQGEQTLPTDQ